MSFRLILDKLLYCELIVENLITYIHEKFISEIKWTLFKSLFGNTSDSIIKLMIFITGSVLYETDVAIKSFKL